MDTLNQLINMMKTDELKDYVKSLKGKSHASYVALYYVIMEELEKRLSSEEYKEFCKTLKE